MAVACFELQSLQHLEAHLLAKVSAAEDVYDDETVTFIGR